MRSHVPVNSPLEVAEAKVPPPPPPQTQSGRGLSGFGGGGGGGCGDGGVGAGYGLRENPKKTWRMYESAGVDSAYPKREKLCKECGKGFRSWRALFGHMRCHSVRFSHILRRHGEQEQASEQEERADQTEGQREEEEEDDEESGSWYSGTEENGLPATATATAKRRGLRRRRSRRAAVAAISFPAASSSSLSEIERELQDVALCLMMLSRDVGFWGGVHAVSESFGQNAAVLGDMEGFTEEKKSYLKKEKSAVGHVSFVHSINVTKKPKPTASFTSETDWEDDSGDVRPRPRRVVAKLGKRTGTHDADSTLAKDSLSKKRRPDEVHAEFGGDHGNGGGAGKSPPKKSRFECTTCRKAFHSYQALGGHRASHKRIDARAAAKLDGGDTNSVEIGISVDAAAVAEKQLDGDTAEEVGRHECGICLKVFPSGQALGGHKRRHYAASSDARDMLVRRQPLPPPPDEVDLNLPAERDEDSGFVAGRGGANPWWIRSRPPAAAVGAPLISG